MVEAAGAAGLRGCSGACAGGSRWVPAALPPRVPFPADARPRSLAPGANPALWLSWHGPRRCPPWVPTRGRGHGAQHRAGPEAGGLVASPAFPWSVWLGSWALPEGKGFCVGIRVPGISAVGFRTRRGRGQACNQPRGLCLRGTLRPPTLAAGEGG